MSEIKTNEEIFDEMFEEITRLENGIATKDAELARLREALKVANQLVIEVNHAYTQGPEWYTRGESGLRQQVAMWIDKASKAIQEALKSNDS